MTLESDAKFEEKLTWTCGLENNMRNLGNFHQSTWKSQNWNFDGVLLSKVTKCMSLKFTGELFVMTMKKDAKLEGLTCRFKIDMKTLMSFNKALKNLKNLHFNGLPLTKVYNVWAKKVQGSYVWWHWMLMQNLMKNWLFLSKITWGIWEIFTRALESLKIWTLMRCFIQSRKCMTLKFTGELFVMTMKSDAKLEEELTCRFKTEMRNMTNFDRGTQKSQKFAL